VSRSQRVELQDAFVLHRRPYQNSSLLLEVYTPDFGRMGLVARGARRAKSPWRGLLQPFTPLLLSWQGRGELHTLIHAEEAQSALALHSQSLLCGFYLNELLMRLSERQDPLPELFSLYHHALLQLSENNLETLESVLRLFELRLLSLLGYGLQLPERESLQAGQRFGFDVERGEVRRFAVDENSDFPLSLTCVESLLSEPFVLPDECKLPIKRLLRTLLNQHLGSKPLQSRALFRFGFSGKRK